MIGIALIAINQELVAIFMTAISKIMAEAREFAPLQEYLQWNS